MSDGPCKSEEQHRIDTLQQMANTEHQLRMARTRYESAKWELVQASEALLEWKDQWSRERSAVFACYPDTTPVDSVLEDARLTMDRFCAAHQPPAAPPAASENAGEQIEASGIEGSFPSFSANDGFSALPGGVEESRDQFDVFEDDSAGYAPVVDAVDLPQVTVDQVPPVAEVIHTDDGRKKFALFGGQTHEVVEPSNTEADFWARVLHPRKENA